MPEHGLPRRVIDAHHHLWDLSSGRYPWLQGEAQDREDPSTLGPLQRDYLIEDYLRDIDGLPVLASVHVEAARDPDEVVAESRWLQSIAGRAGFPQAVVAAARLEDDAVGAVLDEHLKSANVRGIRQMLNWLPDHQVARRPDFMEDSRWRRGLALLAERGLSFDLQVFPHQLADAARLAAQFPDTAFVLNHGGYLLADDPERRAEWRRGLALLAAQPNVDVKASCYAALDPTLDRDGLRAYVATIIELFSPSRSMFASNFPVDRRFVSYRVLLDGYLAATADLTDSERDEFFFVTAQRRYRLGSLAELEAPDDPAPATRR